MSEQRYDFATATFFFFKTIGRRPGGFLAILITQLIAYAVLVSILFAALAPALATIMRLAQSKSEPEFGEVLAIIGSFGLTGLLGTVLYIIVLVSVQAAWLRLMTRDEVKPVIPLRFGLDELRLLGVATEGELGLQLLQAFDGVGVIAGPQGPLGAVVEYLLGDVEIFPALFLFVADERHPGATRANE